MEFPSVPVIQVENLSKVFRVSRKDTGMAGAVKALFRPRFEAKVAVDGITFSVEPGEMVGYIGVNGAGKSTTIKMLTGILVPSGGKVQVLGRDPHRQRVANAGDRRGFRPALPVVVGPGVHRVAQPGGQDL